MLKYSVIKRAKTQYNCSIIILKKSAFLRL